MYERAKNFTLARPRVKRTLGWVCVVIGFVAVLAPVVPGAPLVFVGFELLGMRLVFFDRFFRRKAVPGVVEVVE